MWHLLVLRMCARVDNSIHVQVQVVKLHFIRIGFAGVNGYTNSIAFLRLQEFLIKYITNKLIHAVALYK